MTLVDAGIYFNPWSGAQGFAEKDAQVEAGPPPLSTRQMEMMQMQQLWDVSVSVHMCSRLNYWTFTCGFVNLRRTGARCMCHTCKKSWRGKTELCHELDWVQSQPRSGAQLGPLLQ